MARDGTVAMPTRDASSASRAAASKPSQSSSMRPISSKTSSRSPPALFRASMATSRTASVFTLNWPTRPTWLFLLPRASRRASDARRPSTVTISKPARRPSSRSSSRVWKPAAARPAAVHASSAARTIVVLPTPGLPVSMMMRGAGTSKSVSRVWASSVVTKVWALIVANLCSAASAVVASEMLHEADSASIMITLLVAISNSLK